MVARIGRPSLCRGCGACARCERAAYMRGWWGRLSPEEKRAKTARRDPERVREQDRRKMEHRRRDGTPEQRARIAARDAIRKAKARGDVTPQPCESCGATDRVQAHHDDYARPLDVRWLCRPCHDDLHRRAAA